MGQKIMPSTQKYYPVPGRKLWCTYFWDIEFDCSYRFVFAEISINPPLKEM
jgi:hypothetical protein